MSLFDKLLKCGQLKRRAFLSATVMALACAGAVRGAEPAVLGEIPADSTAAVVINNVGALSTKVSNTVTRLNVPLPIPLPPDLAGFALRNLGINKGFDAAGSAALVVLKPLHEGDEPFGGSGQIGGPPPFILLLPTTSAKDMLEGFSPGEPDSAGISEITLQGGADKGYVSTVDKWVAFAQDRDALVAYLARKDSLAKTLAPEARKTFDKNDLVVWGNINSLSGIATKSIENLQDEMTGMLDLGNLNSNQDPTISALQKEMVNQYFNGLKQYFKDADSAMFTLRLSDAGATLGLAGTFKSGSPFANFVAAQHSQTVSLAGLPSGDYLAAGALTFDSASVSDLFSSVAKQVLENDVIAKDPHIDQFRTIADQYKQFISITTGMRGVMLPAPSGGKQGIFNAVMLVDTTNPEKYIEVQRAMMKNMPAMMGSMGTDIIPVITTTQAAVTIKDVKLDKLHIVYKLREETADTPIKPESKLGLAMIHKIYGEDGLTMYDGIAGKHVLIIVGSDSATLEGAVDAAVNDSQNLANDPSITGLKDEVVENPVMVAYFPITKWAKLVHDLIPEGQGIPQIPVINIKDAPPILVSAGITGSMFTEELHLPTQTISSFIDAVKDFKKNAQGGGDNPPPPQP